MSTVSRRNGLGCLGMPRLTALDGPPGAGKTTMLVRDFKDWPMPCAVITYSKDAADILARRGIPRGECGTVYALSWPHVRAATGLQATRRKRQVSYRERNIEHRGDDALVDYVADAPSKKPPPPELEELHAWHPELGEPPSWIWDDPDSKTAHAVGLARWLAKGAPLAHEGYKYLALDEAQDFSALELSAALALLAPDGQALAVGDPGQAIFLGSKGWPESELPPAWEWADERKVLEQGYRMGLPATRVAANILQPFYWRPPEMFSADHGTEVLPWDGSPPQRGLVLSLSRYGVDKFIQRHDLSRIGVVPGQMGELGVMTIHGAKGHEADDVYVLPWGRERMEDLRNGEPGLLKVLYTAVTRARFRLHLSMDLYLMYAEC